MITVYCDWLGTTDGGGFFSSNATRVRILDAAMRQVLATGSAGTPQQVDDSQIVDWTVPEDGTYLIQVYGQRVDTRNRFNYSVSVD